MSDLKNIHFNDPTEPQVKSYLSNISTMYDNKGKFFDQYLFNKKFDSYIDQKNKERLLKEKVKLHDLNHITNIKIAPYELPLNLILINIKNMWFSVWGNIINYKNPFDNFDYDSYFYLGISLISISLLYIMLSYIFS